MPDAQEEQKRKHDLVKKEMARRANDEILVHNPTAQDYFVKYGGYYWKIPDRYKDDGQGKGNAVVARYIAVHYVKHHVDALILKESKKIVDVAKKKYTGTFWAGEEERVALRTNNPELRKKYIKQLWLGLHRKYGLDALPESMTPEGAKPPDKRPQDEVLIEEIEAGTSETPPAELIKNKPKEEFAEAISERN